MKKTIAILVAIFIGLAEMRKLLDQRGSNPLRQA